MATHALIALMGAALIFIVMQMQAKYRPFKNAEKTNGVVDGFEEVIQKQKRLQVPVINFITRDQRNIVRPSPNSILPANIKKGAQVKILYNATNPELFIAKGKHFTTYTTAMLIASYIFVITAIILILNDVGFIHILRNTP